MYVTQHIPNLIPFIGPLPQYIISRLVYHKIMSDVFTELHIRMAPIRHFLNEHPCPVPANKFRSNHRFEGPYGISNEYFFHWGYFTEYLQEWKSVFPLSKSNLERILFSEILRIRDGSDRLKPTFDMNTMRVRLGKNNVWYFSSCSIKEVNKLASCKMNCGQ